MTTEKYINHLSYSINNSLSALGDLLSDVVQINKENIARWLTKRDPAAFENLNEAEMRALLRNEVKNLQHMRNQFETIANILEINLDAPAFAENSLVRHTQIRNTVPAALAFGFITQNEGLFQMALDTIALLFEMQTISKAGKQTPEIIQAGACLAREFEDRAINQISLIYNGNLESLRHKLSAHYARKL